MSTHREDTPIPIDDLDEDSIYHKATRSKYAKFDKEKRERVLFLVGVTMFSIGLVTCVLSLTVPSIGKATFREIAMWKWCLFVTALLAGLVLSQILKWLVVVLAHYEISLKENVIYYVAGTIRSAWVVLWCGMILLAWTWVVDEPSDIPIILIQGYDEERVKKRFAKTTRLVTITLTIILLGSVLWLVKNVFIMVGKSSFHIRRFFYRVKKTLRDEYIIKSLWNASVNKDDPLQALHIPRGDDDLKRSTPCCHAMALGLRNISKMKSLCCCDTVGDSTVDGGKIRRSESNVEKIIQASKGTQKIYLKSLEMVDEETVSCWAMKILINKIIKAGDQIPYTDYHKVEQEMFIKNESDAVNVADQMFRRLGNFGVDDDQEKGCSEMIEWLHEESNSQDINQEVFRKCMVRAWRFRKALVFALLDNRQIFRQLNRFVNVMLVIVIILLWLVMVHVSFRKAVTVAGAIIAGSAFIFGDYCKRSLDNFSFLFVVHPFDVGDCCLIDCTPVIIERIYLNSTVALTFDNVRRHYPNANLCNLVIINYTRSPPDMGDSVVFYLKLGTSAKDLAFLKDQTKSYIEENKNYWYPEHEWLMELQSQDAETKIRATLEFKHRIKFFDLREIRSRKTKLVTQLQQIIERLNNPNATSEVASSGTNVLSPEKPSTCTADK